MKRKNLVLPLALILGLMILDDVSVANAAYVADNNAAVNQIMMAYQTVEQDLVQHFKHNWAI